MGQESFNKNYAQPTAYANFGGNALFSQALNFGHLGEISKIPKSKKQALPVLTFCLTEGTLVFGLALKACQAKPIKHQWSSHHKPNVHLEAALFLPHHESPIGKKYA